jgi:hypothetical protein
MFVEAYNDPKKGTQIDPRVGIHRGSNRATPNGRNRSVSKDSLARNGANSEHNPSHFEVEIDAGKNGSNGNQKSGQESPDTKKFLNAFGACNFIVTWDGEDVGELLSAILFARHTGDRFIQDKLIEYILNIPFRNPRPEDIPAFVGKPGPAKGGPVWAVDKHGRALVGMPGSESIVDINELREKIKGPDMVGNT